MSAKQQTCYIITCDDCKTEYEEDYTPHFPSEGAGIDHVVGQGGWWYDDALEILLCYSCAQKPHTPVPGPIVVDDCARCGNPSEEHEPAVVEPATPALA